MLLSEFLLCLFLVFSILFKAVPNAPVVARHALLGGLTAAVFKLAFELFAIFRLFGLRRDIRCAGCIARVFLFLALSSLGHCADGRSLFVLTMQRNLMRLRNTPPISFVDRNCWDVSYWLTSNRVRGHVDD